MNQAKISPRFEGDKLMWYDGNTFDIVFTFDLMQTGEGETEVPYDIQPGDKIILRFRRNVGNVLVLEYEYNEIQNNQILFQMTADTTKLFPRGTYKFGFTFINQYVHTLIAENPAEVEAKV